MKLKSLIFVLLVMTFTGCMHEKKMVEESYPDGTPKKVCIYYGKGDTWQLIHETDYYQNGKMKMDGGFRNNQRDGQWTYWYESGTKWSEGSFKEGKNDGKRITYFENGKVRYEAYYNNGARTGIWKFYDESGKLLQEINYSPAPVVKK